MGRVAVEEQVDRNFQREEPLFCFCGSANIAPRRATAHVGAAQQGKGDPVYRDDERGHAHIAEQALQEVQKTPGLMPVGSPKKATLQAERQ